MSKELRFSSENEALQYLADISDKKVKVASNELNNAIEEQDKEKIKQLLDAEAKPDEYTLNKVIRTQDKEIIKLVLDAYKTYNIEIPERGLQEANKILGEEATLAFDSTSKAIQYLADHTGNRVLVAAKPLKYDIEELSKKYDIDEDQILELAKADPNNKGNINKSSRFIKQIIQIYKNNKNIKIEELHDLLKKYNELKGQNKIKNNVPDTIEDLKDLVQNKEINEGFGGSKFDSLKLIDTDGEYRLFFVDIPYEDPNNPFVKYPKEHGFCVKNKNNWPDTAYLFTKNNDFYALLGDTGYGTDQFTRNEGGAQRSINTEDIKPIKNLILKNNLLKNIKGTGSWKNIKYSFLTKEEIAKDPDTLNYAIKYTKDKEIIKLLLDAGAEPNPDTLNKAIEYTKDKEIIKLLLDAGAKPDNSEGYKNTLNYAMWTKNKGIIELVIDAGAKPNEYTLAWVIDTNDKGIIKWVLDAGAEPDGITLNYAIRTQDKEIVKQVLDARAKPNEYTLAWAIDTKDKEIIKLVIDAGAEPDGITLNYAIEYTKDKEIIKLVLDAGAKPDEYTLNYAIDTNDKEIIKLVLDAYKTYNIKIPERGLQEANKLLGKTASTLAFDSTSKAIQYLADISGKRIKVAVVESLGKAIESPQEAFEYATNEINLISESVSDLVLNKIAENIDLSLAYANLLIKNNKEIPQQIEVC
jgi:hypothetical protein